MLAGRATGLILGLVGLLATLLVIVIHCVGKEELAFAELAFALAGTICTKTQKDVSIFSDLSLFLCPFNGSLLYDLCFQQWLKPYIMFGFRNIEFLKENSGSRGSLG